VNLIVEHSALSDVTERIAVANKVLFAFPLYVDSMPGLVMELFESLHNLKGKLSGKEFLFSFQCGFRETLNPRFIERYLMKLTERLGADYAGCISRGVMEGERFLSEDSQILQRYRKLGEIYGKTGKQDKDLLEKIADPERIPLAAKAIALVLSPIGIFGKYWKRQLKTNGVYRRRNDRPYKEKKRIFCLYSFILQFCRANLPEKNRKLSPSCS
jgi:hypothetical protein